MSEWGIALIAAGSAILGSITTGFFAWKAGHRQAEGAEAAGQAQAQALISTVQATLDEQRRVHALEHRRRVYIDYYTAVEEFYFTSTHGPLDAPDRLAALSRAVTARGLVEMEGPQPVAEAAQALFLALVARAWDDTRPGPEDDSVPSSRVGYLDAVQEAMQGEGGTLVLPPTGI
ncbi:hypothetical protein [Streptomyces flavochromogenes]|uniref:hypothetical protein n=1 Tax=Streptomyces flavochromogenes TaxID=68199 RepID=UPI0006924254|nr:hypothetical protein [Streptomyces flavochromogenes]